MKRRLKIIITTLMLAASSFITTFDSNNVEANSSLKNKINNIQEERSENQGEIQQKEQELQELENEKKKLKDEIRIIDHKTSETNRKIREKNQEIEDTNTRIEQLKEEIRVLEERITERDGLLKSRVRSMYKNGGKVNYLEVILGAKSFGDLINRITALSTIAQQDRSILEAHHNDKKAVEEAKILVEEELVSLETQLVELEDLNETLEKQRVEKDRVMSELEKQEGELHEYVMELEEIEEILAAQEKAIKAELAAWEKRQEEERKRQEEASRNGGTNGTPSVTPNGKFMRPATGSVTSLYGMRWGRMHHGIDIGKNGRTGDVPIVAAEAGTVIRSNYSFSYGNVIMISHNVNGRVVTTVYAHLENRFVVEGQRVEKGQQLGYMGNTGDSLGPHLHFEVHEGPWNGAKSNSVNPLLYIPN